jgi:RNA polymerase sigma-70 factor (ECF subfamily)
VLARLAQGYGQALHRFFERRVSIKADVPDLVQDVYLRLSRMADPAGIEKPEHFLFVTAANVLKDSARRAQVRESKLHDELRDDLILHSSDIPRTASWKARRRQFGYRPCCSSFPIAAATFSCCA